MLTSVMAERGELGFLEGPTSATLWWTITIDLKNVTVKRTAAELPPVAANTPHWVIDRSLVSICVAADNRKEAFHVAHNKLRELADVGDEKKGKISKYEYHLVDLVMALEELGTRAWLATYQRDLPALRLLQAGHLPSMRKSLFLHWSDDDIGRLIAALERLIEVVGERFEKALKEGLEQ